MVFISVVYYHSMSYISIVSVLNGIILIYSHLEDRNMLRTLVIVLDVDWSGNLETSYTYFLLNYFDMECGQFR